MTTTTATAQQSLDELAQELKINLRNTIRNAKSKKMCHEFANAFMEQLAKGGYSKSKIRATIPKAIKELKETIDIKGVKKLIISNTSTYKDANTGEIKEKEYIQHYAYTALYNRLNEYGLVRSNAPGHFTLAELTGEPQTEPATENQTESTTETKSEPQTEPVKPAKTVQKKSDLEAKVGDQTALDATKYLDLATKYLRSENWLENIIGVEMAVPRRHVEIGLSVDFYADDTYSLVISTPAKKKDEKNTFYLIPCLVNSNLICEAVERIRKNKPELLSDVLLALGKDKTAKAAFNNSERKRVESIYNDTIRSLLPTDAAIHGRDNQHQLKNIGTCILKQIKFDELGGFVGNQEIVNNWISQAVAHTYQATTDKYINWKITNIPNELQIIATKEYGQVSPEYVGVEVDENIESNGVDEMTVLFQKLLELSQNDEGKLKAVEGVFMNDSGEIKNINEVAQSLNVIFQFVADTKSKQTKLHKALGIKSAKNINEQRIEALVDALIIHNETAEDTLKVHISQSTVRGFFGAFQGDDESPLTVNFHLVKRLFEETELSKKVDDHNAYKGLESSQNLKWRKSKDEIIARLQEILQDKFPDVI
ncbi:MAG: protelomerase family protein [Cyanobacteria bacterium J06633_8]